jgi:hypothetical protein
MVFKCLFPACPWSSAPQLLKIRVSIAYTFILLISIHSHSFNSSENSSPWLIRDRGGHTNPDPVLKNRFLVPECDFNLSQFGAEDENVALASGLMAAGTIAGSREDEASETGRMNRARRDIVVVMLW